jgi:hypothetical protein
MRCKCLDNGKYKCDEVNEEIDYIAVMSNYAYAQLTLSCKDPTYGDAKDVIINNVKLVVVRYYDKQVNVVVYV